MLLGAVLPVPILNIDFGGPLEPIWKEGTAAVALLPKLKPAVEGCDDRLDPLLN